MISLNDIVPVGAAPADDTSARHFVYVASPLSTLQSPRLLRILASLGNRFPEADFILSRDPITFDERPRVSCSQILRQCVVVCIVPDHEGWISRRLWDEMWEAVNLGLFVIVPDDRVSIRRIERVRVLEFNPLDPRRFARLGFRDEPCHMVGA